MRIPREFRTSRWGSRGIAAVALGLVLLTGVAAAQTMPEPGPPVLLPEAGPGTESDDPLSQRKMSVPTIEWLLHRSADGSQPEAGEQQMLWLMNRARQDPTAEGIWLATSSDPDIANGRTFFGVDLNQLQADFAAIPAMPPAAFDIRLHDASELHSLDLIARDAQDHAGQVDKVVASGFSCAGGRFSVFSYADNALNAHAALNIDWGFGPGGVQDPPGHRLAIMGLLDGGVLSNTGLAIVGESNPVTDVGPQVFSGAYCQGGGVDHNRFIVGTVWDDANENDFYDAGEGMGDVMVMPDSGSYYAVTGDSGGYAIPVTSAGNYGVTFSGGGLGQAVIQKQVTVATDSILLDAMPSDAVAGKPLVLRRATDNRWFVYLLGASGVSDKSGLPMTRHPDYSVVSRADFNNDGTADVLVRDLVGGRNGRWVLYSMSPNSVLSEGFVDLTRNAAWQFIRAGLFDDDDYSDVLLRNADDGRWLLYLLNEQTVLQSGILNLSDDLSDEFAGSGDFDGDGREDILMRRSDGSWLVYLIDGLQPTAALVPPVTANTEFGLETIADFNGDGNDDLLLRRGDGRWFMYLMDGASVLSGASPAMVENPDFTIAAVNDFNGDGNADLLLRRSDGRWFMYLMDGTSVIQSGAIAITQNPEFQVVATSDYSGDGNADILLRRSDGRWVMYLMDGLAVLQTAIPDMTRNTAWVPQTD